MIQTFVDCFISKEQEVRTYFAHKHPETYREIVELVIKTIQGSAKYAWTEPDPEKIHEIDDGDYQGTLLYVIPAKGYQPNDYWYVKVYYGSCSGCDTLQNIFSEGKYGEPPNPEQVKEYYQLALNVVQNLKPMQEIE